MTDDMLSNVCQVIVPVFLLQSSTKIAGIVSFFSQYGLPIVIGVVGVALLSAALFYTLTKRKKQRKVNWDSEYVRKVKVRSEATEFFEEKPQPTASMTVKLVDVANPEHSWVIPVSDHILVGRADHCDVRLADKSVSREQYMLKVADGALFLSHLGSTNKTFVNGLTLERAVALRIGDMVKSGRVTLRVDYIQAYDRLPEKRHVSTAEPGRMTESIF